VSPGAKVTSQSDRVDYMVGVENMRLTSAKLVESNVAMCMDFKRRI